MGSLLQTFHEHLSKRPSPEVLPSYLPSTLVCIFASSQGANAASLTQVTVAMDVNLKLGKNVKKNFFSCLICMTDVGKH